MRALDYLAVRFLSNAPLLCSLAAYPDVRPIDEFNGRLPILRMDSTFSTWQMAVFM